MAKIKCTCGRKNAITCPECSAYKMVILLKNGNDHFKNRTKSGKLANPVWYSHLQYNGKPFETTKTFMLERLKKQISVINAINCVIFYCNSTRIEMSKSSL